jgi:hypothetical protein
MFRALLAHPQEAPHKGNLVYCVRIMSVDCATIAVQLHCGATAILAQPILYARNIPNAVCVANPEDKQVTLETCRST